MKRALGLLAATALLASGALALGTGSVGAAATTTPVVPLVQTVDLPADVPANTALVYAVHGLNLAGQTAQTDGGTAVTVCNGDTAIASDFQFGEIAGPLELPWGTAVNLKVFLGAGADCTGTDPAITLATTIPEVPALALVATAGPGGAPELLPVVLAVENQFCGVLVDPAPEAVATNATIQAVHAAAAGAVSVKLDALTIDGVEFGDSPSQEVVPGQYTVTVLLGTTTIVGPATLDLAGCTLTVVYVVGNQPIAEPTTTTTAPAPAAEAVAAAPAFTG